MIGNPSRFLKAWKEGASQQWSNFRQKAKNIVRGQSFLSERTQTCVLVGFGQFVSVMTKNKRMVVIKRWFITENRLQEPMDRSGLEQIITSYNMGDVLKSVINNDR